jgi:hypothetical protein
LIKTGISAANARFDQSAVALSEKNEGLLN